MFESPQLPCQCTPYVDHHRTAGPYPSLSPFAPPGHPRHEASWLAPTCFSCPSRASSAWRILGLLQSMPTSATAIQPGSAQVCTPHTRHSSSQSIKVNRHIQIHRTIRKTMPLSLGEGAVLPNSWRPRKSSKMERQKNMLKNKNK